MNDRIKKHLPLIMAPADAPAAAEPRPRIDLLDVIKAWAIITVIFCHLPIPYIRRCVLYPLIVDQAVPVFILLMGYCYAMSGESHSRTHWENTKRRIGKLLRFALPWFLIVLVEICILLAGKHLPESFNPLLYEHFKKFSFGSLFLMGGYGAGGYFFYVMIQLYLLMPLLDCFKGWKILAAGFCMDLIFEIAARVFDIPLQVYRIIALRYAFGVAAGMFLYHFRARRNRTAQYGSRCNIVLLFLAVIGVVYVCLVTRGGYVSRLVGAYWPTTAMPTVLFLFPALYFLMEKFEKRLFWNTGSLSGGLLRFCGQRSYHIYLFQMLFFWIAGMFISCSGMPLVSRVAVILIAYPASMLGGWVLWRIDSSVSGVGQKSN